MRRRALLATLPPVALAGCSALPDGDDRPGAPPRTDTAPPTATVPADLPTPVATPGRPADLSEERAIARYVRDYEYALVHNRAVNGDRTATSVEVSCEGATSARTEAGMVAFAGCSGGVFYADGSHGDYVAVPIAYYVSADRTVRLDASDWEFRGRPPDEVFAADDPAGNVASPERARPIGIYNFDDTERRVDVSVRYLGGESATGTAPAGETPTVALEATYGLPPRSAVIQEDVAVRRGTYRVAAGREAGPAAVHRWRLAAPALGLGAAVAATPEPDVVVGPVGV